MLVRMLAALKGVRVRYWRPRWAPTTACWLVLGLSLGFATTAVAKSSSERSSFKGALTNTGANPDAAGKLKWRFRGDRGLLELRLWGLEPDTAHELLVDSVPAASLITNARGRARVRLRSPAQRGRDAMDFDPRGAEIAVRDATQTLLEAVGSGEGEARGSSAQESTLTKTETDSGAVNSIRARYRLRRNGRAEFRVDVQVEEPGTYLLYVDGIERATLEASGSRPRGRVRFQSPAKPKRLELDFDPRGVALDLVQGEKVVASGTLEARIESLNVCEFQETGGLLSRVDAPLGSAKARHRVRRDCDQDYRIELEHVEAGTYAVCQDERLIGMLEAVENDEGEVEGELEFRRSASREEDSEHLPLDFEVDLEALSVRMAPPETPVDDTCPATTVLFEGADTSPGSCEIIETRIPVPATEAAMARGGEAKARYRVRDDCERDFTVEVEDLAEEGTGLVCVGGAVRGRLQVALDPDSGDLEGEIEFSSQPEDEALLDFEVDLTTVTVREDVVDVAIGAACPDSTLWFGGAEEQPEPPTCSFEEIQHALLNVGSDEDAKGSVRLRTETDCSRSLVVEIENLPPGDYALLLQAEGVDEVFVGSFADADAETGDIEGRWDFDSLPEADEMELPPLLEVPFGVTVRQEAGQEIVLERGVQ